MFHTSNNAKGIYAENLALKYFLSHGYKLINSRYKRKGGEIDLIICNDNTLIFCEVRFRKNILSAAESINKLKKTRIIETAKKFLIEYSQTIKQFNYYRFDVILIDHKGNISHVENAFEVNDE